MRRITGVVGVVAFLATVVVMGDAPASAAGVITPSAATVAQGSAVSATVSGCDYQETDTDTSFTVQRPALVLVTGSGAGERLASYGEQRDDPDGPVSFTVPGWVDPDAPTVIAGRCTRRTITFDPDSEGVTATFTTVFTYPDVAIDVTPGPAGVLAPAFTLDRSVGAPGQVITASGTGCPGGSMVASALGVGGDLSGRNLDEFVSYGDARADSDGTFELEMPLLDYGFEGGSGGTGVLPEGDYSMLVICFGGSGPEVIAAPQLVTVSGTNPVDDFVLDLVDDTILMTGSGCTGGRDVTVVLDGHTWDEGEFITMARRTAKDLARGRITGLGKIAPDPDGRLSETITVTPDPDGTWRAETAAPGGSYDLVASAECGDATTDGFRYVQRSLYDDSFAELYVERVSPTSSPTSGSVTLSVNGVCEGEVTVGILDRDEQLLARSGPLELTGYGMGMGTVTAPSTPGEYRAVGLCDDEWGYGDAFTVFAPETVSAEEPLPADPTTGWPSTGEREVYHGRIGPIMLPAQDMEAMSSGAKLPPSALFIPVPRPDGDFAITKMSFDVVDADGMPVGHEDAHLHHFVITNKSAQNPACPGGTFGLPGQIVGAAGAERTVLDLGDPYGVMVEDTDEWTGVYELMSRSSTPQEVYLTYDLDLRRDTGNVRPVTRYFGSATGCSTFTWTIDGSGTPDVQSHFITIDEPGRLVGAGGHVHNGGLYSDFTNDRGRRLCRSELLTHDMAMPMAAAKAGEATTTMVGEVPAMGEYPPEFYDDDPMIEGITTCGLAESVSAGERIRFDATYENERARSGAMGIFTIYVWEGGGPATPTTDPTPPPPPADPVYGESLYAG